MIPEQQEITRVVHHLVDVHVRSEWAIRPHFMAKT